MLTYNKIISLNEEFAEAHHQIKTFGNGEAYKLTQHSKQDWFNYPVMWVEDLSSTVNDRDFEFNFRIYFVQQVATLKDREEDQLTVNYTEAKSNMIDCATDLLSFWAKDLNYPELNLIKSTSIQTFEDDWDDLVTGCWVDLKIKQGFRYNKCAIPMSGVTPPPSECAPVSIFENGIFVENVPSGGTYSYTTATYDYDLFFDGVDTGENVTVDGTDITINLR